MTTCVIEKSKALVKAVEEVIKDNLLVDLTPEEEVMYSNLEERVSKKERAIKDAYSREITKPLYKVTSEIKERKKARDDLSKLWEDKNEERKKLVAKIKQLKRRKKSTETLSKELDLIRGQIQDIKDGHKVIKEELEALYNKQEEIKATRKEAQEKRNNAYEELRGKKLYQDFLSYHKKVAFRELKKLQDEIRKDRRALDTTKKELNMLQEKVANGTATEDDKKWVYALLIKADKLQEKLDTTTESVEVYNDIKTAKDIANGLRRDGLYEEYVSFTGKEQALQFLEEFKEVVDFASTIGENKAEAELQHVRDILDNSVWSSVRQWTTKGVGLIDQETNKKTNEVVLYIGGKKRYLKDKEVLETISTYPTIFQEESVLDVELDTAKGEVARLYEDSIKPVLEKVLEPYRQKILETNEEGRLNNITGSLKGGMMPLNFLFDLEVDHVNGTVKIELNDNAGLALAVGALQALATNSQGIYTPSLIRDENGELQAENPVDVGALGARIAAEVTKNLGIKEARNEEALGKVMSNLETGFGGIGVALLGELGFIEDVTKYNVISTKGEVKKLPINGLFKNKEEGEPDYTVTQSKQEYPTRWKFLESELNPHVYVGHSTKEVTSKNGKTHKVKSTIAVKYAMAPIGANKIELLKLVRGFDSLANMAYGKMEGRNPDFPTAKPKLPSNKVHRFDRDVPPVQHRATSLLSQQAMKFNSGMQEIYEEFAHDKKALKKKLGWMSEDEILGELDENGNRTSEYSKDDQEKYLGKSLQIDNIVEDLFEFYETVGDGVSFQEWFTAKQDRIHVKNTLINYMEDKHLVRWLFSPEGWNVDPKTGEVYTRNRKKLEDLMDKAGMTEEHYLEVDLEDWMFINSVVQAFEGAIIDSEIVEGVDKEHPDYTLRMAKKILNTDVEELRDAALRKEGIAHIGHAALAIKNIERYQSTKGDFISDLYGEVDGKTNGVFHRLYQFGSTDFLKRYGDLVGVSLSKELKGKTLREQHDREGKFRADDTYSMVGKLFTSKAPMMINKAPILKGLINEIDPTEVEAMAKDTWSKLRGDVKDSTMISMYGAGVTSLFEKFVINTGKKAAQKIMKGGEGLNLPEWADIEQLKREVSQYTVEELLYGNRDSMFGRLFYEVAITDEGRFAEDSLFSLFASVFEESFKEQMDLNADLNAISNALFNAVGQIINNDIEELRRKGKINKYNIEQVIKKYKHLLPNVSQFGHGLDVEIRDDKLYFYKTRGDSRSSVIDTQAKLEDKAVYQVEIRGGKLQERDIIAGVKSLEVDRFMLVAPGASAGPIQIHSLDSNNLSLTLLESYAEHGVMPMPMHDAIIIPPFMYSTIKSFNRAGHEINTSFSYLENLEESFAQIIVELWRRNITPTMRKNNKTVPVSDEVRKLDSYIHTNREVRKLLLESEKNGVLTVAQMDGIPGTAFVAGESETASFSNKEQRINLLRMINDEDSFAELVKKHRERLDNGVDTSLWATANSMAGLTSKKEVSDKDTELDKQYNIARLEEASKILDNLGTTVAGAKELTSLLQNVLGSKSTELEELKKEFIEGCK